jgi:hypothetical protein
VVHFIVRLQSWPLTGRLWLSLSHENARNPMFKPLPAHGLVLAFAVSSALATAQTPAPAASAPAAPVAASPSPVYQSALDGYKPYTDEATANWKEANDTTARIGGWRVYAKEASQPKATDAAAKSSAPPAPAKP